MIVVLVILVITIIISTILSIVYIKRKRTNSSLNSLYYEMLGYIDNDIRSLQSSIVSSQASYDANSPKLASMISLIGSYAATCGSTSLSQCPTFTQFMEQIFTLDKEQAYSLSLINMYKILLDMVIGARQSLLNRIT